MALIKCRECGKEVSSQATTCPHCGVAVAKPKKTHGCGTLLVLAVVAFIVIGALGKISNNEKPRATPAARSPSVVAPKPAPTAPVWQYSATADSMSGKEALQAAIDSTTRFRLAFPYQGEQSATLTVRKHPRHGVDSILIIERGQLQCGISDGCKLQVRFDDSPPQNWTFVEPESHDSTILFLRDGSAFAKKVAATKKVRIELKFFQQAPVVVEFSTEGLDLKKVGL